MKAHYEIEQGSLEWFNIKWAKIGGTLSKGLFVKSDTLFYDILSQKTEEFNYEEGYTSDDMQRGKDLEPFAIEYLEGYSGIKFNKVGWLQSKENELLGISPDGINKDETICAEVKCFGAKKHIEVLCTEEIPSEYIHQIIHYFTVNKKLQKLYWCAFRPEAVKNFVKELTLDSEVNIGTNARPVVKTIKECTEISLKAADELKTKIDNQINKLKF